MAPGKAANLDDEFDAWEQQNRAQVRCMTCRLDPELLGFVHRLRAAGKPYAAIAGFLKSKGHVISEGSVRMHFVRRDQP